VTPVTSFYIRHQEPILTDIRLFQGTSATNPGGEFGFFEAKFAIFGFFSIPLVFVYI